MDAAVVRSTCPTHIVAHACALAYALVYAHAYTHLHPACRFITPMPDSPVIQKKNGGKKSDQLTEAQVPVTVLLENEQLIGDDKIVVDA